MDTNAAVTKESASSHFSLPDDPPFSIDILWPPGSNDPPPLASLLPAVFREEGRPALTPPALTPAYLAAELGLGRLDGFSHHWFWLLGSPALPRPLHDCAHHGRTICLTERMDRHLGLGPGPGGARPDLLYLKPLPRLLLDTRFWQSLSCACGSQPSQPSLASQPPSLSSRPSQQSQQSQPSQQSRPSQSQSHQSSQPCHKGHLRACALGFLYSYVALLPYESDFRIAAQHGLLPPQVTWPAWCQLARQVTLSPAVRARRFHRRFCYGELRLHRLREVSQLRRGGLLPVLVGRLDRVARFFHNNLRWLASLVAYVAIMLDALETGLATDRLAANAAFQSFSAGFTIFALVGPLAILLTLALYFGLSVLYHVAVHLVSNHFFADEEDGANAHPLRHWDQQSEA